MNRVAALADVACLARLARPASLAGMGNSRVDAVAESARAYQRQELSRARARDEFDPVVCALQRCRVSVVDGSTVVFVAERPSDRVYGDYILMVAVRECGESGRAVVGAAGAHSWKVTLS